MFFGRSYLNLSQPGLGTSTLSNNDSITDQILRLSNLCLNIDAMFQNSLKGPSQIQKQTSCDNEYADINTLDNEAPKHDDQTQNHASSNESAPDFDNDDYQGIESHYSKIQLLESKTDKISSEVDSEKEAYVNPCSETDMGNYDAYNIVSPLHNDMYVEPNKEKSNASKDESSTKTEQVTTYKRTNEGGVCHDTEYVDGLSDYADLGDN